MEHVDVLIIGAGLSGIGAAHYLKSQCPWATYVVLETRHAIGGTWDLFRYPGVRSDSDMFTLGYAFRPWMGEKTIVDGGSILQYLKDTATEAGVDRAHPVSAPGGHGGLVVGGGSLARGRPAHRYGRDGRASRARSSSPAPVTTVMTTGTFPNFVA